MEKAYNFDIDLDLANSEPRDDGEDGHAEREPEVLLSDDMGTSQIPFLGVGIVEVSKDDKEPCTVVHLERNIMCKVQSTHDRRPSQPEKR